MKKSGAKLSLELAELYGLKKVVVGRYIVCGEVSDGTGDTQNAVESTGRKAELLDSLQEHILLFSGKRAELTQHLTAQAGIAGDTGAGISAQLALACSEHSGTNRSAAFAIGFGQQARRVNRRHLDNHVETVEQRTGNLAAVAVDGRVIAAAAVAGVAEIAAGAWVHGSHQHEPAGEIHAAGGAGYGDNPAFERLAQGFECATRKLRQLIEEQHAVVRQGYFTGGDIRAATHQPYVGNRVVRGAIRSGAQQATIARQQAADGVNLAGSERFFLRERGQNGGQTARQHALATAGTAAEQQVPGP